MKHEHYILPHVNPKIPMKRKRMSPIQDAMHWCRAKRDKDGFTIEYINNFIGSGVFTEKKFLKGDFLLEYGGNLLSYKEGLATEKKYKTDPTIGSFLYFFNCGGKKYCVDATYSHSKGRMINDAIGKNINCIPKVVIVDKNPRICFFAAKDLELHAELRYNYGDGLSLPWRQKTVVVANSKQSSVTEAPQFMELLKSTAVVVPNDVILRCNLKLGKPEADIKWYKGSEEIGNSPKYETIYENNTATLVVHQTGISDAAVYKCQATNLHGQIKTDCSVTVYSKCGEIEVGNSTETLKNFSTTEKPIEIQQLKGAFLKIEDNSQHYSPMFRDNLSLDNHFLFQKVLNDEVVMPSMETDCEYSPIIKNIRNDDKQVKTTEEKQNYLSDDLSNSLAEVTSQIESGSEYHPTKDSVKDALSDLKDDFDDEFDNADSFKTKAVKEQLQNNKPGKEEKIELNADKEFIANDSVILPRPNNLHIQEKDFGSGRKGADKKHCCLYCNKVMPQMPRHLKKKHADEIEVARALACPLEKDRRLGIKALIYEGDYQHNYNVLENGQGTVIPRYSKRKGSKKVTAVKELVPCEHCKALFGSTEFYRHKCPLKTLKETVQSGCSYGVKRARLLLPLPVQHKNHSQLYKTVICNMQEGEVKLIVEKDSLIKEFGSRQLENVDKEVSNTQVVSTKMRELARLMIALSDIDSKILHLKQAIFPINWEKLLTAVKNVAGYNVTTGRYQIPSLALKLGYSLKHCANIAYCHAIIDGDETSKKNYIDFLQLYNSEFYNRISSKAQYTLHIDKFNKPLLLPLSEDVTALHNHLKKEVNAIMASPEPNYQDLAEAVLAQVILFNRKRSGEAQRMKLEHYQNALKKSITPPDKEILKSLSKFEAALCTSVLRVEIRGKRGRKVPVLLTEDMQKGVRMLIKLRKNPDVQPKRDYLFARPLDAKTPFYGNVAIRKHTMLCGAKQPELMTSTGLRKQLGTMCQVLALSEQQQDVLANFMGHDLQVHREFYRLPESYFEVAKVTKILHAINEGRISEFKGKDYDSIIINNDEKVEFEDDDIDEEDQINQASNENQQTCIKKIGTSKSLSGQPIKKLATDTSMAKSLSRRPVKKRTYTEKQHETISSIFKTWIQTGKVPGKLAIENAKRDHNCLVDIPWKLIKYYIKNLITKRKKLPKL